MLKQPPLLLRLEAFLLLATSVLTYWHLGGSPWLFLLLLLVPDVTMLGYAINVRVGALVYNAGHTLIWPLAAAGAALYLNRLEFIPYLLIWTAHIGMDRLFGYGLKYPTHFQDTHLQRI